VIARPWPERLLKYSGRGVMSVAGVEVTATGTPEAVPKVKTDENKRK